MGLYDKPESFKPLHWFWIIGLGLLYAVYTALSWSIAYVDFGDGNYMYIGWRIAQGAVVYRDILAPQPPCHLFLGAAIAAVGGWVARLGGLDSQLAMLYCFRTFSLLLHLATYALVLRLAWRAWGRPITTVVAGAIWLWLPIGFWWALGYQSEPLEILFLLLMMTSALRATAVGDLWAGVFAALAGLTNATAAPFLLVLIIYMLLRAPLRALRMTAPCVLLVGAVVGALQWWTQGAFLQNVVFNQVGTFPGDTLAEFWGYARGKLLGQGASMLSAEGGFLALALIGLWRYLATSPLDAVSCAGLAWFFLSTFGSIVYVTKGGTMDYIFSLAEPAVAILAAGELVAWGARWKAALPMVRSGWVVGAVPFWLPKLAGSFLLAFFFLGPAFDLHWKVRHQQPPFELPAETVYQVPVDPDDPARGVREVRVENVARLVHLIQKYSKPGERILAPPYYAFLARRALWGDYSELFIWQMKYRNERRGKTAPGEGIAKTEAMAAALRDQQLPLAIVEMDQTGALPPVTAALRQAYVPLKSPLAPPGEPAGYIVPTNNTRLGIFAPLGKPTPERLAEQQAAWREFQLDLFRYYGIEAMRMKFPALFDLGLLAPPSAPAPAATPTPSPAPAPAPSPSPTPAPAPKRSSLRPIVRRAAPTTSTLATTSTAPSAPLATTHTLGAPTTATRPAPLRRALPAPSPAPRRESMPTTRTHSPRPPPTPVGSPPRPALPPAGAAATTQTQLRQAPPRTTPEPAATPLPALAPRPAESAPTTATLAPTSSTQTVRSADGATTATRKRRPRPRREEDIFEPLR